MWKFWLCLLGGVFCLLAWMGMRQEGAESESWPSVPGTITEMRVTETHDARDGTHSKRLEIQYTYSVDGKAYRGDRVSVASNGDADAGARQYPEGKSVNVFYNPKRPGDAVLERGASGAWIWGFGGIALMAFAFYLLADLRKQRRAQAAAAVAIS